MTEGHQQLKESEDFVLMESEEEKRIVPKGQKVTATISTYSFEGEGDGKQSLGEVVEQILYENKEEVKSLTGAGYMDTKDYMFIGEDWTMVYRLGIDPPPETPSSGE